MLEIDLLLRLIEAHEGKANEALEQAIMDCDQSREASEQAILDTLDLVRLFIRKAQGDPELASRFNEELDRDD
jgi:hypothetical protein